MTTQEMKRTHEARAVKAEMYPLTQTAQLQRRSEL
jgi:hypothetical protein